MRLVNDGHTLGDHSFDHMGHNSNGSPVNAYQNLEKDFPYFGTMNARPVLELFPI